MQLNSSAVVYFNTFRVSIIPANPGVDRECQKPGKSGTFFLIFSFDSHFVAGEC